MFYITNILENQKIFQALSSSVRLNIINLLHKGSEMSINDLARALGLTNSALTAHVKILSDCGLIKIRFSPQKHGTQKLCSLAEDKILIELIDRNCDKSFYDVELNVGQYTNYEVNPPCGLSTVNNIIGGLDGPQFYTYPDRFNAEIIWFTDGSVTYTFPNPLKQTQTLLELQITMEIAGEAPGAVVDFPTNIDYYLNGLHVGRYLCPGEFFDRQGRLSPDWWPRNFGQYGMLRIITINDEGTFFNGIPASEVTLKDLDIQYNGDYQLTISCKDRAESIGGITLFGKRFGDHTQGIRMRSIYSEDSSN